MRFITFCSGLLLAVCSYATTAEVSRIKLQQLSTLEAVDTTLESGELAYTMDAPNSIGGAVLRVGDGVSPGGAFVSDIFAMRAPYIRQLRQDEYVLQTYGNVSFSNNTWELITPRTAASTDPANTGTLMISSAYPISEVMGTEYNMNGVFTGDALNTRTADIKTNYTFSGSELSLPSGGGESSFRCAISNLTVWGWFGAEFLNITNDARTCTFLVADPLSDDEPVNMRWHNTQLALHRAEDWSRYPATRPAELDWYDLRFNTYISCASTGLAGNIVWRRTFANGTQRDLMTLSSSNRTFAMRTYSNPSTTSVVVLIDAACPFAQAPIIQQCTNLMDAVWTDLPTVSTWPTATWSTVMIGGLQCATYQLTATYDSTNASFFRVYGIATNTDPDALTLSVPLVIAPTACTAAPPSGVSLYVDAGQLWSVRSTGERYLVGSSSESPSSGGVGLSNIVINGVYGTQSGSGSNLISSLTLTAADLGAVATNNTRYLAALTNAAAFDAAGTAANLVAANSNATSNAISLAISALQPSGSGASLTGITAAQVGAISNTPQGIAGAQLMTNKSFKINGEYVTLGGDLTVTGSGISANISSNITYAIIAPKTNLVTITGSNYISNSGVVQIPLVSPAVQFYRMRFFFCSTNDAPIAQQLRLTISDTYNGNANDMRCGNASYWTSNVWLHSTTTTAAGVAGAYTNVVPDASGFFTGADNLYAKPLIDPIGWQTATNVTGGIIAWKCSNVVETAVGTLISHVTQLKPIMYFDKTGGTNMATLFEYIRPYTNWIGWHLEYVPL